MRKLFTIFFPAILFFTCGDDQPDLTGFGSDLIAEVTAIEHNCSYEPSHVPMVVCDSSTVTLSWQGVNTISYIYRLEPLSYADPVETYRSWSDWSDNSSIRLENLDEGIYDFWVRGLFNLEQIQLDSIKLSFEVDAIAGPALRIYPLKQIVPASDASFDIYLYAEEIDPINPVMGIEAKLNISNENIEYIGWEKGSITNEHCNQYDNESACGEDDDCEWDGEFSCNQYTIYPPPSEEGRNILIQGVVSGSGQSGTDPLIKLTFTFAEIESNNTTILIDNSIPMLFDLLGQPIEILSAQPGLIEGGE